jgi:hypothetical protein
MLLHLPLIGDIILNDPYIVAFLELHRQELYEPFLCSGTANWPPKTG